MIEKLNLNNRVEYDLALDFLSNNDDYDFYFTKDNARIYITDKDSLKKFVRECSCGYVYKDRGDYKGIILVWKSDGGGKARHYVKLNAENEKVAIGLITVLLWNFSKELFVKIRKESKFMNAFKHKGFRFMGARGVQILLNKKIIPYQTRYKKEEERN